MLLEVAEGRVHTLEEVVGLVRKGRWKELIHPQAKLEVSATCTRSRVRFREVVEKKVAWAVQEAVKGPFVPDRVKRPSLVQRVSVRLLDDVCTLSLDAGGELLHLRGWRQEQGEAPMRENLAASCLLALDWRGEEPLLDPFCGSGTIVIEAALLALGRSPFAGRRFAFEEWPALQKPTRGAPAQAPASPRLPASPNVTILGFDRDARVLGAASANARRAGVDVALRRGEVADLEAPSPLGLLFTNPPWGERLAPDPRAVARTWDSFGRTIRERFAGWRVAFVCPDADLARRAHPRARRRLTFPNGGLKVALWEVEA
jgi:putative N6-adenine-specific DNA methylase